MRLTRTSGSVGGLGGRPPRSTRPKEGCAVYGSNSIDLITHEGRVSDGPVRRQRAPPPQAHATADDGNAEPPKSLLGSSPLSRCATANQIARRLKVSPYTIKNLLAGVTWRSVPDPLGHGSGYPGTSHGRRCSKAKLNDAKVREIRRRHAAGETQADLCREFKITACPMSRLIRRMTWKHVE